MSGDLAVLDLNGLDGTNPAGFLAGLGVLTILNHLGYLARLWWSDSVVPRARLDCVASIDALVDEVMRDKEKMADAPLLAFPEGNAGIS
jgi:hypothetical protein